MITRSEILDIANTAIENVPKLATGEISPRSIFNRYQLTLQSFGLNQVNARLYKPGQKIEPKEAEGGYTAQNPGGKGSNMHTGGQGSEMLSALGTPVFCDLKLKGEADPDTEYIQLLWVLVDVDLVNNIVKTKIQGRNGTDKEYISRDDYVVRIRGAISNTFGREYPKEAVAQLNEVCQRGRNLDVVSEYLQIFKINSVVVERASFKQQEGRVNIQTFDIECLSDEPLYLRKRIGL